MELMTGDKEKPTKIQYNLELQLQPNSEKEFDLLEMDDREDGEEKKKTSGGSLKALPVIIAGLKNSKMRNMYKILKRVLLHVKTKRNVMVKSYLIPEEKKCDDGDSFCKNHGQCYENYTSAKFCICETGYGGPQCDIQHSGSEEELLFVDNSLDLPIESSDCNHCSDGCNKYQNYEFCLTPESSLGLKDCTVCEKMCGPDICKVVLNDKVYYYKQAALTVPQRADSADQESKTVEVD
ncbi:hypothetical protein RF11_08267 [Thelohanellus kitauei]|uniref:EGF-like domain-containing protein n=1 Tax=Thelohanellus kitauei TaxID=669202 RepID=A0A0C2MGH6_THEKT|nr:hypothetical protein RF11_08267 [Thelohanellus kitauei]